MDTAENKVIRLAVPTEGSGGLMAQTSAHFGHCSHFTVVEIVDGEAGKLTLVENPPHQDCFGPVRVLAGQKVDAIVVKGIGMRPLSGFNSVDIAVYAGDGDTVGDQVTAFAAGQLSLLDASMTCSGGNHAN